MFQTLGRYAPFGHRIIFANLWCFKPLLGLLAKKKGGEIGAMLKTTCAFTMMEGSSAANVIPPKAKVTANLRLIGGETVDSAIGRMVETINNPDVRFRVIQGSNPPTSSSTDGEKWQALQSAIRQTWPEAIVSPYLMYACTDSRHYHTISDHVYRFSAMELTKQDRELIHSHNERILLENLARIVQFYTRLMRQL